MTKYIQSLDLTPTPRRIRQIRRNDRIQSRYPALFEFAEFGEITEINEFVKSSLHLIEFAEFGEITEMTESVPSRYSTLFDFAELTEFL